MKAVAFWDRGKTGVAGDGSRAEVPWYVACHRVPPRATACHRLQPPNTASKAAYGTPPPQENKKLNTRTTVGWFCFFLFCRRRGTTRNAPGSDSVVSAYAGLVNPALGTAARVGVRHISSDLLRQHRTRENTTEKRGHQREGAEGGGIGRDPRQ